ncbi:hypothetical protein BO70DRAFT_422155, partial [Aspergillus heteromorphus CBS 117.55]
YPLLLQTRIKILICGPGITVLRRMGLESLFRAHSVPEQGLRLVDGADRSWGYFPANRTGKGRQNFTTDFEIMRGDLCALLVEETKTRGVMYMFGGHAAVNRKKNGVHSLGILAGYFTMPRPIQPGEEYTASVFIGTGGCGVMMRRHEAGRVQVYLLCETDELGKAAREGIWRQRRKGWRRRSAILTGFAETDDFDAERMGVVRVEGWSRGRVVLVGDAAYAPSAQTGMGTSSGMVGAYILAGEIGRSCGQGSNLADNGDLAMALKMYESLHEEVSVILTGDYSGVCPLCSRVVLETGSRCPMDAARGDQGVGTPAV